VAVQVNPIKPTSKAPGSKCLKLRYDGPLSKFAFKFNFRRYIQEYPELQSRFRKHAIRTLFREELVSFKNATKIHAEERRVEAMSKQEQFHEKRGKLQRSRTMLSAVLGLGRVVQIDPMKPKLKPPGTTSKRLKHEV